MSHSPSPMLTYVRMGLAALAAPIKKRYTWYMQHRGRVHLQVLAHRTAECDEKAIAIWRGVRGQGAADWWKDRGRAIRAPRLTGDPARSTRSRAGAPVGPGDPIDLS